MAASYSFTVSAELDKKSLSKIKQEIHKLSGEKINIQTTIDPASQKGLLTWVKNIKSAKSAVDGYNQSWFQMIKTATKYRIASLPFYAITIAANEAKEAVVDFDAALTEFKKVSDLSGDALDDYTKKLGELGSTVARTRTQMVEGATQFKKSGFSDEDSAQLAQIAAMFQNVADSELSAGDAASFIISQMKAFGVETEDAVSIIDKINEVSNNFAVSSTDISTALSKTSSAMGALGNDLDETIG